MLVAFTPLLSTPTLLVELDQGMLTPSKRGKTLTIASEIIPPLSVVSFVAFDTRHAWDGRSIVAIFDWTFRSGCLQPPWLRFE